MAVKKKKKLYEGKTKTLYETENQEHLILTFRDDLRGANGTTAGVVEHKGALNNQLSSLLFRYLESFHIPTHFVATVARDSMLVRALEMIAMIVVVHNSAGNTSGRRSGAKEVKVLEKPLLEFRLKDPAKKDPVVGRNDLLATGMINGEELHWVERCSNKANAVLKSFFTRRGLLLESLRLEFGRYRNRIVLGDEISLDSCSLVDLQTGERHAPERPPKEHALLQKTYQELGRRVLSVADKHGS